MLLTRNCLNSSRDGENTLPHDAPEAATHYRGEQGKKHEGESTPKEDEGRLPEVRELVRGHAEAGHERGTIVRIHLVDLMDFDATIVYAYRVEKKNTI